ncbi:MAG: histidine kinase N-terminal 7TM domain-containing protein [Haloarculaceae archaeon]
MEWQHTPYTVPLLATAAVALAVVVPVWRTRTRRGSTFLAAFLLSGSVLCLAHALRFASTTLGAKLVWHDAVFLGATAAPASLFLLVAEITGHQQWVRRRRIVALVTIEGLLNLGVWLHPYHGLLRTDPKLVPTGGYVTMTFGLGPYYYVVVAVQYVLLLATTYWLVEELWQAHASGDGTHVRQVALVTLAMAFPWAGNVLFVTGGSDLDLTPFGVAATGVLVAIALYRYRFLDVLPVARSVVVENIDNGVVVLDGDDTVVDANRCARAILEDDDPVGRPVEDAFDDVPSPLVTVEQPGDARDLVSIRRNGDDRHYEVKASVITDSFDNVVGRAIVFDDITKQVERRQALQAREEELDLTRQVLSRVLRHNVRNELQVVKAQNEILLEELDGDCRERARRAVAVVDDLVALSAKAREIDRVLTYDRTPRPVDVGTLLEDVVEAHRERFPNVSFECRTDDVVVETTPAIELLFENLIENAAEHNTSDAPSVTVSVEEVPAGAAVTIRDDGPGIPDEELAVLERGEETDLHHGSSLGLWIVEWLVESSDASIRFDTGPEGTTVTVHLPT